MNRSVVCLSLIGFAIDIARSCFEQFGATTIIFWTLSVFIFLINLCVSSQGGFAYNSSFSNHFARNASSPRHPCPGLVIAEGLR